MLPDLKKYALFKGLSWYGSGKCGVWNEVNINWMFLKKNKKGVDLFSIFFRIGISTVLEDLYSNIRFFSSIVGQFVRLIFYK